MGLFSRHPPEPDPSNEAADGSLGREEPDWSRLEDVRAEWAHESLNREADLAAWRRANRLYDEHDDYATMLACAEVFGRTLAHSLYGSDILTADDLPQTVHRTLFCALYPPPDGQTFAESAQRAARAALMVMRENGWQPPAFGGSNPFFEPMISVKGNYFLLTGAVAPPQRPWEGDLEAFFNVPPSTQVGNLPDPEQQRLDEIAQHFESEAASADGGDTASSLYMEGAALSYKGDKEGALAKYTEAAQLGSADAMAAAGDLSRKLGREQDARFWYESAAQVGHPIATFNVGIEAYETGDPDGAIQWFEKAAAAGNPEGYAALVQVSSESGDEAREAHWAKLGAEAGHTFCMARHGLLLARQADGDVPTLRHAREFLEQAAERGNIEAIGLAVSVNGQLGDSGRARKFVELAIRSGDEETIDRLRRHGML